nr:chaperone protein DnaJ 20, chloroplastic-like [Tanacetum cinerariifolium]
YYEETLYDLLGISESVSLSEIKRAYKQMALKYHPDVSPPERADEYTTRFIRVQEAYETLSDPEARAMYDSCMAKGLHMAFSGKVGSRFQGGSDEKRWWKTSWEAQVTELRRRSEVDERGRMSWSARMSRIYLYLAKMSCYFEDGKVDWDNHREDEDQEENNLSEIKTLTYHVLATYGRFLRKDCAQIAKNQSKMGQYQHKIRSQQQKPDQDGKPIMCNGCEGMLRGGFCFPCNLKAENSYNCYQNAYSFNDTSYNFNHFPQPQYENYLCNLCGNNSHDGYDCQQQFPYVYEQEPSYNQNNNDNYYPHESPSFPCCDNCGGSHETFQRQPMAQNIDFSGSEQIQTPQYPEVHPLSPKQSDEYSKPKDPNELFQKLLGDLKELAEYENSQSRDRPIFFDDNEEHSVQNKECFENSSDEIATSNSNKKRRTTTRIQHSDSKDRPPMLAPENYIQWKSRIKRYIDTKPNRELIHFCLTNPPYELGWKDKPILDSEGNPTTTTQQVFERYKNVTQEIRDQLNAEAEAVQIILTGIDNDIYSIVDACLNACKMWKAIERLKQGESINVQDLETNLFWEFGKFTSLDGESLESYYSRLYKLMNELTRNQCKVTNHQVNVQFLLQLQPEWQRFVTLVKQSQELKHVSYHRLYDILKQHQHEVNEIRAEKIARVANPLALDNSLRIHRNTGYEGQRSGTVTGARETVGSSMVQKFGIQCYNCKEYGHVARECQKPKRAKDAAYHREKMLLCKQEEARI